eukprot:TRINITY_DN12140_c0_g1_i2.p6 TRINITY_DN12140_c0_g1~~TRINITY_DN12140_c0_g1_i2.p6  ORF type:complete len:113 (-),score=15.94 TRINITY_DN12140_c0_g1_i2:285-623(-)
MAGVSVGWNNVRDEGAASIGELLKNNNTISELNIGSSYLFTIEGNNIWNEGAREIWTALMSNQSLETLDLSIPHSAVGANNITSGGVEQLEDVLKANTVLHKLHLGTCCTKM